MQKSTTLLGTAKVCQIVGTAAVYITLKLKHLS